MRKTLVVAVVILSIACVTLGGTTIYWRNKTYELAGEAVHKIFDLTDARDKRSDNLEVELFTATERIKRLESQIRDLKAEPSP